mmetsp:Transcript_16380/g.18887  ORF Transcript_16380/g.18887 Transcript_16380/m.18887 type:complete len:133 (+) Transcript_16380:18-416(+)
MEQLSVMKSNQQENQNNRRHHSKTADTNKISKSPIAIESLIDMHFANDTNKIAHDALGERESNHYYGAEMSISVDTNQSKEYSNFYPSPKLNDSSPIMNEGVLKSNLYQGQRRGRFLLWPVHDGEKLNFISS